MNRRQALLGIVITISFFGAIYAISGANVDSQTNYRWNGVLSSGTATTTGGNISLVQISATQLTSRWAAYFGNITTSIRLDDGQAGAAVFVWNYSLSTGEVCVAQNTSSDFTTLSNVTAVGLQTAFSVAGAPDNGTATFTSTCPTMNVNGNALTGFLAAAHHGSSSFRTCAANYTAVQGGYVFCTNINVTGTNYNSTTVHYELMVPANGTSVYSFYAELT